MGAVTGSAYATSMLLWHIILHLPGSMAVVNLLCQALGVWHAMSSPEVADLMLCTHVLAGAKPEAKAGEAWRRQFRRKWGLEQLRALQKRFPADDDTLREPWDDALALVQAVNSSQAQQVHLSSPTVAQ